MAGRRRNRIFSSLDRDALLAAIGFCRSACVRATAAAPINEPIYRATAKLMVAIDDLAEVLTGDRTHFHDKNVVPASQQPLGGR